MRQESHFSLLKKLDSTTSSNILQVAATSTRNKFPSSFHFVSYNSVNALRLFHSSISSNSIKIDQPRGSPFTCMKLSPCSSRVFLGHDDGTVSQYLISAQKNNRVTIKPHFKKINDISFSGASMKTPLMATSSNDKLVKLFSLKKFPKSPKFRHSFKAGAQFALKSVFEGSNSLGILTENNLTFFDLSKMSETNTLHSSSLASISAPQVVNSFGGKIDKIFVLINFQLSGLSFEIASLTITWSFF